MRFGGVGRRIILVVASTLFRARLTASSDGVRRLFDYDDDEVLELTFSTAWSPPQGVVEKLKEKYPDLSFSCFYDEPGMEIAGYY